MPFTYEYPHPSVTADIVIFTVQNAELEVLLICRKQEPFKNQWALPGGFLDISESLSQCAKRELKEETGIENVYLEQLYTFGDVGRDPRERVISIAYYALMPISNQTIVAGDDAAEVQWFKADKLPKLAFDHQKIITMAKDRLAAKMEYSTIGLQLMPAEFTLTQLQHVYEATTDNPRDKRNFRKWILSLDMLDETGGMKSDGPHRPAKLYRVRDRSKIEIIK